MTHSKFGSSRALHGRIGVLAIAAAVAAGACGEAPGGGDAALEATVLWIQPADVTTRVYAPNDFKVESRSVVWAADEALRGIVRLSPPDGKYGVFGWESNEPSQVVRPIRLAVSETVGVFAYDAHRDSVDLYTPSGQWVRGFRPGFRPSIMELSRAPFGLVFGTLQAVEDDSLPRLVVIETDLRGANVDTLLSATAGPPSLRDLGIQVGRTSSAPSGRGLWIWPRAVLDTVFEVAPGPIDRLRKVVLPRRDTAAIGILSDVENQILWTVIPSDSASLRYRAYDVSAPGTSDGEDAFLGTRTTPTGFAAQVAMDGAVFGLERHPDRGYRAAAFDLRVAELRR